MKVGGVITYGKGAYMLSPQIGVVTGKTCLNG